MQKSTFKCKPHSNHKAIIKSLKIFLDSHVTSVGYGYCDGQLCAHAVYRGSGPLQHTQPSATEDDQVEEVISYTSWSCTNGF